MHYAKMTSTTYPLSPESRKPLHTQVHNLREERVHLLESQRTLRERVAVLGSEVREGTERMHKMRQEITDGSSERAKLLDELDVFRRDDGLKEALVSQLRIEATQWQARLEQGETERTRRESEAATERRHSNEH